MRIAFVSIGAGPINHPLSRWFMKNAARLAAYRSFRDEFSLQFMKRIGLRDSRSLQFPDIAFRLPVPPALETPQDGPLTVGVGVMHYRGWEKSANDGEATYKSYIERLSHFVVWLSHQGYSIRLLTGDSRDQIAVADVMARVRHHCGKKQLESIEVGDGGTLHDLMREMQHIDVAIVSRYHNVICALKLGKPIISLSYAQKNDEILGEFKQSQYCEHIETFDLDTLVAQFRQVIANLQKIRKEIADRNEIVQAKLAAQERLLLEELMLPAAKRAPRLTTFRRRSQIPG